MPEPTPAPTHVAKVEKLPINDDVKSDWDASSDDEAKALANTYVKDSWDASSGDEDEPASVAKLVQKSTPINAKSMATLTC
jgi:translation initiation factor 5B